jgi:hypothetical protein
LSLTFCLLGFRHPFSVMFLSALLSICR